MFPLRRRLMLMLRQRQPRPFDSRTPNPLRATHTRGKSAEGKVALALSDHFQLSLRAIVLHSITSISRLKVVDEKDGFHNTFWQISFTQTLSP